MNTAGSLPLLLTADETVAILIAAMQEALSIWSAHLADPDTLSETAD